MSSGVNKPIKIGLTGGVGSGKTVVGEIFRVLGVPVYNSDQRAREITNEKTELIKNIKTHFGDHLYNEHNELNRKEMREIVFNDPEKLKLLNSFIHPEVQKDFNDWYKSIQAEYIIKESAIIFESGIDKTLDQIICVFCPDSIRLKRLMKRDNISEKSALEIINNQWPQEKKMELSDYVIFNDENQSVTKQVLALHKIFTNE